MIAVMAVYRNRQMNEELDNYKNYCRKFVTQTIRSPNDDDPLSFTENSVKENLNFKNVLRSDLLNNLSLEAFESFEVSQRF